jgi:hypothetical protein
MNMRSCDLKDKLAILSNTKFPVYFLEGVVPSIVQKKGMFGNKVVIYSIPKSGTYLVSKLLEVVGYADTEIHLGLHAFQDYRGKTLKQKREDYLNFTINVNACAIAKLILNGQFVVGHLPYNEDIRNAFASFKQIFLYREVRDALISHMRFLATRNNPAHDNWRYLTDSKKRLLKYLETTAIGFMDMALPMVGWLEDSNTLKICFERLCGDAGEQVRKAEIRKIFDYLGVLDSVVIGNDLIRNVFNVETLTWSGQRTDRGEYWSDEAEKIFKKIGGDKLNKILGYDIMEP